MRILVGPHENADLLPIAPYFAFLYTLLNDSALHILPSGGALATTPFSLVEMDLYRLAGVEEVRVLN